MYGNFTAEESASIVRKRLEKGAATVEVDDLEQSRILFLALTEEEIEEEGIKDILHSVKEGETKPKLTDQEITGSDQFRTSHRSKLDPPIRKPTHLERKKLTFHGKT